MKTRSIARGIVGSVAALLGVMAAGCSADVAPGDEAQIGSTAEALTNNADLADFSLSGRYEAASCVVTDNRNDGRGAREFMLVATGYDGSGAGFKDAALYDPVVNTWLSAATLPNNEERGEAKLLKLSSGTCLLVGGLSAKDSGATRPNAYVFTANGGTGTWTAAGSLNAGRAKFAVSQCGTGSQVAVFGGHDASGETSPVAAANTIEVWNGSTGGAATWTGQNKLSPRVSAFAFASKDPQTSVGKWAVAGGESGAGYESAVQTFTSDASCAFTKLTNVANLQDPAHADGSHSLARVGAAAVFGAFDHDSNSDTTSLYVTAGEDNNGSLPTDVQRFTVKWTTATTGSVWAADHTGAGVSLPNGVRMSTLVNYASNKLMLVGGESNNVATLLESSPDNHAQELDVSAASVTPAFASVTLNRSPLGSVAEFLNSKVYLSTGLTVQGVAPTPDTVVVKTQSVTP